VPVLLNHQGTHYQICQTRTGAATTTRQPRSPVRVDDIHVLEAHALERRLGALDDVLAGEALGVVAVLWTWVAVGSAAGSGGREAVLATHRDPAGALAPPRARHRSLPRPLVRVFLTCTPKKILVVMTRSSLRQAPRSWPR
jgi:hypothetical protein